LVGEDWLDPQGNTTQSIQRSYDAESQLISIFDSQMRLDYSYDKNGRVLSEVATVSGAIGSTTLAYAYDAVGNLISRTDSRNGDIIGKLVYQFDSLNRPTQLSQSFFNDQNASARVAFAYDAAGQMLSIRRHDDSASGRPVVESNQTYDANGRMTRMVHMRGVDSLVQYDFARDSANRMTSSSVNGSTTTYGYDTTDQLVMADHSNRDDETFAYDLNGNRTNSGYAHATNNQLTTDGSFEYTYDNNGNRTKRRNLSTQEVTEYVWDYRNRLTEARSINSSGEVLRRSSFAYDPMDRRIRRSIDTDGNGPAPQSDEWTTWADVHPAYRWDNTGSMRNRFLFGPLVDMVLAEHTAGQTRWPLADQIGSIRHVADTSGVIRNEISYDSFGRIVTQTNTTWQPSLSFAGSAYDSDLDLYQMRSRYYDPRIGRFVSEDPIAFSGGDANLVRYASNQPISQKDPYGTDVWVAEHTIPAVKGIGNFYHRAIILAPNNPQDFANDPLFKQTHYSDLSGKPMLDSKRDPAMVGRVATLGGEPNGKNFNKNPIFGNLIGVDNFSGDAPDQLEHWTLVKTPKGMTDTEFIRRLIDAAHRYKNNKEYWPVPVQGDESYNSNSYVSGIIIAAGGEPPVVDADVKWGPHATFRLPTIAPGYDKPLPIPPNTPTPVRPARPQSPLSSPKATGLPPSTRKPDASNVGQSPSSRGGNIAGTQLGDLGASQTCSPSKPQPKKPTSPSKPPSRPNVPTKNPSPSPTHKPSQSKPANHPSANNVSNPTAVDAVMATMGSNGNGVMNSSPQAPVFGPAWGITRTVTHKLPKEVGDKILAELSYRFGTKITSYKSKVEYDPGFGNSSKMAFKGAVKFTRPATPEELAMAERIRQIDDEMRNPETRRKHMEEFADRLRNVYGIPWNKNAPIGGSGFHGGPKDGRGYA
jgi:RHS repeat-associated protein